MCRIVCFPATKDRVDDKDNIMSTVESILTKQSKLESNILNGIKYMIAEIVDNIIEHSHSAEGYIFAQYYPTHGYIDNGISTKNRPNAENRGYGIKTSKRMLVDGLGGQYMMLSATQNTKKQMTNATVIKAETLADVDKCFMALSI